MVGGGCSAFNRIIWLGEGGPSAFSCKVAARKCGGGKYMYASRYPL